MGLILAYDTETTGLPDFKAPSEAPHQPHIVQLAAVLVDEQTRKIEQSIDLVIFPDGWMISPEIALIHGITQEKAESMGVSEAIALQLLLGMWECCNYRLAHNEPFDMRIVRIACMRYSPTSAEAWKAGKVQCTQQLATPILKLPPTPKMIAAGFNKNKSANLTEAYEHFTGKPMQNAHSAMADTLACLEVFWAIKDRQAAAA
jgi:DNA polymerase III subunit epsilon